LAEETTTHRWKSLKTSPAEKPRFKKGEKKFNLVKKTPGKIWVPKTPEGLGKIPQHPPVNRGKKE